ncbi:MAG: transglycosylase SLT domain-containing protein [Bacteroidales bacterium]
MSIRLCCFIVVLLWLKICQAAGTDQDSLPDLLIEFRLAELDNATPVSLEFNNHVNEFITVFSIERREAVSRIIGLSELYFPIIEEILDRHSLPHEIKYLAIIESALDPRAVSSSGAIGLWQFLLHTARMFDLEVNSYVDERRDVFKSTEAAARYMAYLYEMFGDWHLVFAAYNSGPGVVRNAIERAGGSRNYWELRKYLPEQSQRFIPAYIAINYIMHYYEDYQIAPLEAEYSFQDIDTLHISRSLSLRQVSGELNIPLETLRFLNPVYRLDYIPGNDSSDYLVLPSVYVPSFLKNMERIYASGIDNSLHNIHRADADSGLIRITHRVKAGEFIHKIAIMYGTLSSYIMEWNKLDNDLIYEGQELEIWVSPEMMRRSDDTTPLFIDYDAGTDQ